VTEEMTAEHHGNPGFPVLATPVVVELMEQTAVETLGRYLDEREGSVGARVDIRHTAPTPVGRTSR
jgi:predicted thioesterase